MSEQDEPMMVLMEAMRRFLRDDVVAVVGDLQARDKPAALKALNSHASGERVQVVVSVRRVPRRKAGEQ